MEILVNFSVREDKDHRARICDTLVIRDVVVKSLEEVYQEIQADLENSLNLCFDELGLPEDYLEDEV